MSVKVDGFPPPRVLPRRVRRSSGWGLPVDLDDDDDVDDDDDGETIFPNRRRCGHARKNILRERQTDG